MLITLIPGEAFLRSKELLKNDNQMSEFFKFCKKFAFYCSNFASRVVDTWLLILFRTLKVSRTPKV